MQPTRVKSCNEKSRLAGAYTLAARLYSAAVTNLGQNMGRMSKDEYDGLRTAVAETLQRSEDMRVVLEQHLEAHGCWHESDRKQLGRDVPDYLA